MTTPPLTRWLQDVGMNDLAEVGGKNASLGEMIGQLGNQGVAVPGGFATTAHAFELFLRSNRLDSRIRERLAELDTNDVRALATAGDDIRGWIGAAPLGDELRAAITSAYRELEAVGGSDLPVAVRSSATAEDLPEASFAGQQESYLNVRGVDEVIARVRDVYASLFTDRAIAYRTHQGFDHSDVAISAGVQQMVESLASGVMFTVDTETGFTDAVFVTAAYGLGELVVQGAIDPDEFYVYKPALRNGQRAVISRHLGKKQQRMDYAPTKGTAVEEVNPADRRRFSLADADVEELARQAITIEDHYGRPMDIEWAKSAQDGHMYILQARPETVQSNAGHVLESYEIGATPEPIVTGRSVGNRIGSGQAVVIRGPRDMERFPQGGVLIADMTDPDWEPIMKKAAAIVTNRGGRTCHAAIIAREMGIPAVVGSGVATELVAEAELVTVSCAEGDTGFVYSGEVPFEITRVDLDKMPEIPTKIMMNVASPDRAFTFSRLPHAGVGLARLEFVINNVIGVHPNALLNIADQPDDVAAAIAERSAGYEGPVEFFVEKLAEGIATIGAAFAPAPVIVRLSDFKTNEYAHLIGGRSYEPDEENPMIGFRGASRYRAPSFVEAFKLECRAIRIVREDIGLRNVELMVPFVRTVGEADEVLAILADNGLERGKDGLRIIMMCEVPSNAILAEDFLERFDGFSIGSNDLTQLTLAIDRDSALVAGLFSENDAAVRSLIERAVGAAKKANKYIGICGQGPSDDPDFAAWLVDIGIDSMSLNPDAVVETWLRIAERTKK
ncbi:MAG: phosphoenolpyruvate synthase [Acidimicrobiia bacterium]|nr:phosphoenolpyruvate synthase [Acidimicrobiia bacterium]